jgi:hypothetical protein
LREAEGALEAAEREKKSHDIVLAQTEKRMARVASEQVC